MPELPEVETTLRGIEPYLKGKRIYGLTIRERRMRFPMEEGMEQRLEGQRVLSLWRRGKYLLFDLENGGVLLHLGMSGSLRVLASDAAPGPHDHVDLQLEGGYLLRLRDPRRFGFLLWTSGPPGAHPLIRHLGPEPLGSEFSGSYLRSVSRGRRAPVKNLIMNARIVVGVGNIYANESLFLAGIHPNRRCGQVSALRYDRLAGSIREVLTKAIEEGGTTLRDFVREDGRPGYFVRELKVYGREGAPCLVCGGTVRQRRIGQRSSFFCPNCQK